MVDTSPEVTTKAAIEEEAVATTTEVEEAEVTKAEEAFNLLALRSTMEDLVSRCSSFQIISRSPQGILLELFISTVSERSQGLNLEILTDQ